MRTYRGENMQLPFINREPKTNVAPLIDAVLDQMHADGASSDEFHLHLEHLERLEALKTKDRRKPLSRDVLAQVVGNLAGIGIIVGYEQAHVIATKAFDRLIRPNSNS